MLTTRRQREGLRWVTDKPPRIPLWQTIKDAIFIVAVLFGILREGLLEYCIISLAEQNRQLQTNSKGKTK